MDDAIGARREVVLGLPHFQSVALAVGRSDLIAALPVQYARAVAEGTGLELFQLPIPSPAREVRCTGTAATTSLRPTRGSGARSPRRSLNLRGRSGWGTRTRT